MNSVDQAKSMARKLRSALAKGDTDISHSEALELVANTSGYSDWNTACAKLDNGVYDAISFGQISPIIRIFDEAKAREFYCRFLGLEIAFEHRHEGQLPFYIGVERAGALLHLTEHHDDASPGSNVFLSTQNIRLFHRELLDKQYSFGSPDLEELPWSVQIQVHDPFGNRIRFCE